MSDSTSANESKPSIEIVEMDSCKLLDQPVPIAAASCKRGGYVILNDFPCKVSEVKISKTGKHGSAKANITGYDIMTNRKYQETHNGSHSMHQYTPVKMEYEVASIQDNIISAITEDATELFFTLPENELGQKLNSEFSNNTSKNGDLFWIITVVYAPRKVGDGWKATFCIESCKQGK